MVDIKRTLRDYIAKKPLIYIPLANLKAKRNSGQVAANKQADIIIEGYPRSANTFAFVAFSYAQDFNVKVARHFHAPAQLIYGIKKEIPSVMLLRDPVDAVSSLILRGGSAVSAEHAFASYINFYDPLKRYVDHLTIAPFQIIISDFDKLINAINQKWNTKYHRLYLNEHKRLKINELIKKMDKEDRKRRGRLNLDGELSVAYPTERKKEEKN